MTSWADDAELKDGVQVPSFELDLPEPADPEDAQPFATENPDENLAPSLAWLQSRKHLSIEAQETEFQEARVSIDPHISEQRTDKEAKSRKVTKARASAKAEAVARGAALEYMREQGATHSRAQILELAEAMDTEETQRPGKKYKTGFRHKLRGKNLNPNAGKAKPKAGAEPEAEAKEADKPEAEPEPKIPEPGKGKTGPMVKSIADSIRRKVDAQLKEERDKVNKRLSLPEHRVVSEAAQHKPYYGFHGREIERIGGKVKLSLECGVSFVTLSFPEDSVIPCKGLKKAQTLKTPARLSRAELRYLVELAHHSKPHLYEVSQADRTELSDAEVQLWVSYLIFSLAGTQQDKIKFYPTELCVAAETLDRRVAQNGLESLGEEREMYERLQYYFRKALSIFKLHILLCRAIRPATAQAMGSHHFTLLSLTREAETDLTIRYYDGMTLPWTENKEVAKTLLRIMLKGTKHAETEVEVPKPRNEATQVADQCGLFDMHYCEEELRHYLSEGWATQGLPNEMRLMGVKNGKIKGLFQKLRTLCEHCEAERERWCAELDRAQAQSLALLDASSKKAQASKQRADFIEIIEEDLQSSASAAMIENHGPPLIHCEDWGLPPLFSTDRRLRPLARFQSLFDFLNHYSILFIKV